MAPAHQYQPPSVKPPSRHGGHDQPGGQHECRTSEPKSPPPGNPELTL